MLTEYIQAALDSINWKIMDDGSFYAEIPLMGLHTNMPHLEECQSRIRQMLEEHIVISISQHNALPSIGGVELKVKETA
jgi:predicted RNase H-like HicB family nuclease